MESILLWTACFCRPPRPKKLCVEILLPKEDGIRKRWGLWRVIRVSLGHETGALVVGLETRGLLSLCAYIREGCGRK